MTVLKISHKLFCLVDCMSFQKYYSHIATTTSPSLVPGFLNQYLPLFAILQLYSQQQWRMFCQKE